MITTLDQKHHSRSEKYKVVSTKEIAARFKELGFVLDEYTEARVRTVDRRGYQKHMVRLSNPSLVSKHGDLKIQLLVVNSHDGSSTFKMKLGFFRFVCSNGMVVGEFFEDVTLRHSGNIIEQIDKGIERIVAQLDVLNEQITKMKSTTLTPVQERRFIEEAIKLRNIKAMEDVPAVRKEDEANDLFTVYNRVQEALVRGGNEYVNNNDRTRRLRSIRNIDAIIKINQQLYDLAMRYVA